MSLGPHRPSGPSQWSFQGQPARHAANAALHADLSQLSPPCATVAFAPVPTTQPQHRSCSWQQASVQLPSCGSTVKSQELPSATHALPHHPGPQ